MTKDKKFDEYYAEAKKEKIAVGALYKNDVWDYEEYNYLHNENFKEDVNYEIDFLLSNLKGKKMTLPVILELDTENLSEKLSQQDAKYLLDTYKEKIESAGYIPGLSVNEEGLAYLKDACSESLEGYDTMREQKTSADSLEYYTRAVDTDGKVFNAPSIAREINTTIDYEYRDGREVYPLTGMGLYAVGLGTVETRKKLKEKTKVKTK